MNYNTILLTTLAILEDVDIIDVPTKLL